MGFNDKPTDTANCDYPSFSLRFSQRSLKEKLEFLARHPYQPASADVKLPFSEEEVYFWTNESGQKMKRTWLSVQVSDGKVKALFFPICIAFSIHKGPFTSGCDKFRHCAQMVRKHEISQKHCQAARAYLEHMARGKIDNVIISTSHTKKKDEVHFRIEVLKRVFHAIKFLAK